jgi:hypothetical protein
MNEKYNSEDDCPHGGDVENDCLDCVYSGEYHYDPISVDCVPRDTILDNDVEKVGNYVLTMRIQVGSMTFVLGENPNAPSPYVTWQNLKGRTGYDLGHYMNDRESAVKDLHRRANNESKFLKSINTQKPKERDNAR